jgi:hypothetical protein
MKKQIIYSDNFQKNYKYFITEKAGKNFDKDFKPDLTPKEMLELGVFGGVYMRDCKSEFPKDWFTNAKLQDEEIKKQNSKLNYFQVKASQNLKEWKKKGWIHLDDPRGWFQWYCRYYMGRRHSDDARQIKRWQNMKRHILWLQNGCGVRGLLSCRPRQRQALLHWAYDSRKL